MLVTEYLKDVQVYSATPVIDGKPNYDYEYFFSTEEACAKFCQAFFHNPIAADFAYRVRLEGMTGYHDFLRCGKFFDFVGVS